MPSETMPGDEPAEKHPSSDEDVLGTERDMAKLEKVPQGISKNEMPKRNEAKEK